MGAVAKCELCDATTAFPVGADWRFPYIHSQRRVRRVCPACAATDYLPALEALSEARAAAATPERGRRAWCFER
jgi:hypothetical protein